MKKCTLRSSTEFPIYRCLKEISRNEEGKTVCTWNNNIWDYPDHISRSHPNSYFVVENQRVLFSWSIPMEETQFDRCILECEDKHYLYEVLYKNSNRTIRHRLWFIPQNYNLNLFSLIEQYNVTITMDDQVFNCSTISNTFKDIEPANEIITKCNSGHPEWILQIH